jgi:hypothetical protein
MELTRRMHSQRTQYLQGDAMDGWVKIHRSLLDHPLWTENEFSKGQAWIDLIAIANHSPSVIHRRGIRVEILRGQVGQSYRSLAERWKWSTWKVQKFMDFLVSEDMICKLNNDTQNETVSTLITIVNYEKFQETQTQNNTQTKRKTTQNKNVKNEKNKEEPLATSLLAILPVPDNPAQQFVRWWAYAYTVVLKRKYKISWGNDVACANEVLRLAGGKKQAIGSGCQMFLDTKFKVKTLQNLSNGSWNRYANVTDDQLDEYATMGLMPGRGQMLGQWLTEKINGANQQQ